MVTTTRDTRETVEQQLRQINAAQLSRTMGTAGDALIAAGVTQAVVGILAMIAPTVAGAFFVLLLGAAIVASGIIDLISSFAQNRPGRFILGLVSIVGGALVMAHPIYGLGFLTALVGIYLIGAGIVRLFGYGIKTWARVGGAIGIIFGIIVLAQLPAASATLVGLLVGLSILIDGILTIRVGNNIKKALRASIPSSETRTTAQVR